jgi:hypothetical protein
MEMIDEVAQHLQIGPPRPIAARHAVIHKIPEDRAEAARTEGPHLPEFENGLIGAKKEHRAELQRKHSLNGLAAGIFLGALFLGGIAVSSSQQSRLSFSDLSAKWEDFSRDGRVYLSDSKVKVKEFFGQPPGWMREAVRSHWKNFNQSEPAANPSKVGLADSNDANPGKRTQPGPAEMAEKPAAVSQELQEPKQDNKVPIPVGPTPAETQKAENTGPLTGTAAVPDNPNGQQADSQQLVSSKTEVPPPEVPNEGQTPYLGDFKVVEKSFVRDTPASDAQIITILKPGTVIRVEGKTGKYFDVRSLSDPKVRGYVHQEDAFFKPIK